MCAGWFHDNPEIFFTKSWAPPGLKNKCKLSPCVEACVPALSTAPSGLLQPCLANAGLTMGPGLSLPLALATLASLGDPPHPSGLV